MTSQSALYKASRHMSTFSLPTVQAHFAPPLSSFQYRSEPLVCVHSSAQVELSSIGPRPSDEY